MYIIYSKVTEKTPVGPQRRRSGVFIVNFEHIVFVCSQTRYSSVSTIDFKQINGN